jgi:hypothetical protein
MIKLFSAAIAAGMLLVGVNAFADSDCCKGCAAKGCDADNKTACGGLPDGLELSKDQKSKIAALKAKCDKAGCTPEAKQKFVEGLRKVLTADQLAKCKELCAKQGVTDCPLDASEARSEAPKSNFGSGRKTAR